MKSTQAHGEVGIKSEQARHSRSTTQMAMFAAIGDKFICSILKQVAADYSLDYKELKRRYTGPTSLEEYEPSAKAQKDLEEFDLETVTVKPVKPKKVTEKPVKPKKVTEKPKKTNEAPVVPLALSKMKKQDLIDELDSLGIDSTGLTVVKLKEKVKEARESSGVVVAKGGRKPKAVKEVPVHNHGPLTEELVEDCRLCDTYGDVVVGPHGTQLVTDETEGEDFVVDDQDALKARLAALIAEADGDEDDEADDEEDLDGNVTEGEELEMED